MHPTMGSSTPSHGSLGGVASSQEPARIREDFSRILEGIRPQAGGEVPLDPASEAALGRAPLGAPVPEALGPEWYGAASPESAEAAGSPMMSPMQRWQCGGGGMMAAMLGAAKSAPYFVDDAAQWKGIDLLGMFPFLFSFVGFMSFLGPIWLMVHLSHDPNIVYWIGHYCEIALLLPVPFFLAFFIQAKLRRPHKATILLTLLVPAATLLALGDVLVNIASDRADQLRSRDCDTFAKKRELERSWQAAHRLYMGCLRETVKTHNITMDAALSMFRVQDCQEYPTAYTHHARDWEYLWFLEEEHQCAGWCQARRPVWTLKDVSDSCSTVVSQLFFTKVRRMAKQAIIFSIFVLVGTSLANLAIGPGIRSMGFDW